MTVVSFARPMRLFVLVIIIPFKNILLVFANVGYIQCGMNGTETNKKTKLIQRKMIYGFEFI